MRATPRHQRWAARTHHDASNVLGRSHARELGVRGPRLGLVAGQALRAQLGLVQARHRLVEEANKLVEVHLRGTRLPANARSRQAQQRVAGGAGRWRTDRGATSAPMSCGSPLGSYGVPTGVHTPRRSLTDKRAGVRLATRRGRRWLLTRGTRAGCGAAHAWSLAGPRLRPVCSRAIVRHTTPMRASCTHMGASAPVRPTAPDARTCRTTARLARRSISASCAPDRDRERLRAAGGGGPWRRCPGSRSWSSARR